MSVIKTKVKRFGAETAEVEAEIHTSLRLEDLLDAEAAWSPVRIEVLKRFLAADVPDGEWPQSFHWSWASKAVSLRHWEVGSALSPYRLMGVKALAKWQGLVLTTSVGHQTRLSPAGRDLLYVDYVESAPWNLTFPGIGQTPALTGVGRQLMETVVRLSRAMDCEGRVGLHSLGQSESTYRRWLMTDLGPDGAYHDLRYFELSETQSQTLLGEVE